MQPFFKPSKDVYQADKRMNRALLYILLAIFIYIIAFTVKGYLNRKSEHYCKDYQSNLPAWTENTKCQYFRHGRVYTNHKEEEKLLNRRIVYVDQDRGTLFNFYLYICK